MPTIEESADVIAVCAGPWEDADNRSVFVSAVRQCMEWGLSPVQAQAVSMNILAAGQREGEREGKRAATLSEQAGD